jgi:hypothetical protein
MEASQHSLLAACFTLHSINATLAIVPQGGAGLWNASSYSGSSGAVSAQKYFSRSLIYRRNVFFSIFHFYKNITIIQIRCSSEMSPKTEFEEPTQNGLEVALILCVRIVVLLMVRRHKAQQWGSFKWHELSEFYKKYSVVSGLLMLVERFNSGTGNDEKTGLTVTQFVTQTCSIRIIAGTPTILTQDL